ncbi:GNAT family N-acetyltransferase [Neotamlana laminarinivorans]|uniref:GNAT family N-acetyltransferase n=1 Tax=Neotamlana laminarinivorans TaxID=2883124 RepID=A0A9X1I1U5_9FLAO|nr:GNAT family N-acetyltransferase [Tamlana laminarinivorans]MCB4798444.1 GNAT family N-acetyltransferase [Tamlana laminarinivorans]
MNYTIRKSVKSDMPQVLKLINELAEFEKEPDAVEVTLEDLENDGFGKNPAFKCFVAEIDNKVEGIALIYNRYSTWKGKIIHLEDLIVSKAKRGLGIGTALLDEVVKYGHNQGVKRINWEVIDWNEPAIKFYESKGANVMRDWDVVQLSETAIQNYISKLA